MLIEETRALVCFVIDYANATVVIVKEGTQTETKAVDNDAVCIALTVQDVFV